MHSFGLRVVMSVGVVIYACADVVVVADTCPRTFTLDADFDEGTMDKVNHTTVHDQLQLTAPTTTVYPYINVACTDLGTLVRIHIGSQDGSVAPSITGEYLTAPSDRLKNPSRTTVDRRGNVWVANRAENESATDLCTPVNPSSQRGSIARMALLIGGTRCNADGSSNPNGQYLKPPFDYCSIGPLPNGDWQLLDRDADGKIKTSLGLGNVLAWTNAGGVDTNGGVSTAEDELIVNYTRVTATGARAIAVDVNNDVWVGGDAHTGATDQDVGNHEHEQISGATGQCILGTQFNVGCGGYGGLIDRRGVLWSAQWGGNLLRYDPATQVAQCLALTNRYGLAIDPTTGHVWASGNPSTAMFEIDPETGGILNSYTQPWTAQGVAVDCRGHVWVAQTNSPSGTQQVLHLAPDARNPGYHYVVGMVRSFDGSSEYPFSGSTGVAVDKYGKIWVTERYGDQVTRIDPNLGPVSSSCSGGLNCDHVGQVDLSEPVRLRPLSHPYNYSDMTGFGGRQAGMDGTWTVIHDGGHPWDSVEPGVVER